MTDMSKLSHSALYMCHHTSLSTSSLVFTLLFTVNIDGFHFTVSKNAAFDIHHISCLKGACCYCAKVAVFF